MPHFVRDVTDDDPNNSNEEASVENYHSGFQCFQSQLDINDVDHFGVVKSEVIIDFWFVLF